MISKIWENYKAWKRDEERVEPEATRGRIFKKKAVLKVTARKYTAATDTWEDLPDDFAKNTKVEVL